LTAVLQPALDRTGCSDYGGNGNGTAFPDQVWDLFYPSLLFSWILSVLVEQVFPVTWNGRRAIVILARALVAVMAVVIISCGVALQLLPLRR
jgi:hypothetical protein